MLRHGFASLYRPHNQTSMVVVVLGLGVCMVGLIALTQENLLRQIEDISQGERPNLVLFDIQTDQRSGLRDILQQEQIELIQEVPIVTMRLDNIDGKTTRTLRDQEVIPSWALRREYRSTYRDTLADGETLLEGQLPKSSSINDAAAGVIPITAERDMATRLMVGIGSRLTFDVQGVPLETEIVGIREVDWRRIQTNFFFVFPPGVLEEAPQFWALISKASTIEALARVQSLIGASYPNVSAIDLTLVLETADKVVTNIAKAVRFLGAITFICALLVLGSTIAGSRRARENEDNLYRIVGATRAQLRWKHLAEFGSVGALGTILGLFIAIGASWGVTRYGLKVPFAVPWFSLVILSVGAVTWVGGLGFLLGNLRTKQR